MSRLEPSQQPEAVARTVWDWRRPAPGATAVSDTGALRREGILRAVIGAILGTLIFLFWHRTIAYIAWSLAGLTLIAALASPGLLYRGLRTAVAKLGFAIGWVLSWLLLPAMFYLVILPYGGLRRLFGRDRLERGFEPDDTSYWKQRSEPAREAGFYERQF